MQFRNRKANAKCVTKFNNSQNKPVSRFENINPIPYWSISRLLLSSLWLFLMTKHKICSDFGRAGVPHSKHESLDAYFFFHFSLSTCTQNLFGILNFRSGLNPGIPHSISPDKLLDLLKHSVHQERSINIITGLSHYVSFSLLRRLKRKNYNFGDVGTQIKEMINRLMSCNSLAIINYAFS